MKKIFAVILSVVFLIGTLSGCGKGAAGTYADMMKLLERMQSVTEGEIYFELSSA